MAPPSMPQNDPIRYLENVKVIGNFINGTQTGITAIRFENGVIQDNLLNLTVKGPTFSSGIGINLSGQGNQIVNNAIAGTFQYGITLNGIATNTIISAGNNVSKNVVKRAET